MHAPLIITAQVRAELAALRELASKHPVDMAVLGPALAAEKQPGPVKQKHMEQMNRQSVVIPGPWLFWVTYSVETNHPCGTARHMSMSIDRPNRVPNPIGVWMVAKELGFEGEQFEGCYVDKEELSNRGLAVNVIQPLRFREAPARSM